MNKMILLFLSSLWSAASLGAACGPIYGADGLAIDKQGGIWITHYEDIRLGWLEPKTGQFTEFLPDRKANPFVLDRNTWDKEQGFDYGYDFGFYGIALDDQRGLVWSNRFNSDKLVRFSRSDNKFVELTLPGRISGRFELPIDSQGNLWLFSGACCGQTGDRYLIKIDPEGRQKNFNLPVNQASATNVAVGKTGKIWLSLTPAEEKQAALFAFQNERFDRIALPKEIGTVITRLHVDKQDTLWLASGNDLWKMENDGFKRYTVPTPNAKPAVMASDTQGNLWFSEWRGSRIGRISADGKIEEYPIPVEEESPRAIAVDTEGQVWFSVSFNYGLFQLDPTTGHIREFPIPVPSNWSKNAAEGLTACAVKPKDALSTLDVTKTNATHSPVTEQMIHSTVLRHPKGFPEDEAAVAFEKNCQTACHTWYRVDKAAARRSDWRPTVDRMIEFNKAAIAENDRNLIVQYLNRHYTMAK
jgi:streptogramin lyase